MIMHNVHVSMIHWLPKHNLVPFCGTSKIHDLSQPEDLPLQPGKRPRLCPVEVWHYDSLFGMSIYRIWGFYVCFSSYSSVDSTDSPEYLLFFLPPPLPPRNKTCGPQISNHHPITNNTINHLPTVTFCRSRFFGGFHSSPRMMPWPCVTSVQIPDLNGPRHWNFVGRKVVKGGTVGLLWLKSGYHQLRLVVYPIIYRCFSTSLVVQDFWTINTTSCQVASKNQGLFFPDQQKPATMQRIWYLGYFLNMKVILLHKIDTWVHITTWSRAGRWGCYMWCECLQMWFDIYACLCLDCCTRVLILSSKAYMFFFIGSLSKLWLVFFRAIDSPSFLGVKFQIFLRKPFEMLNPIHDSSGQ